MSTKNTFLLADRDSSIQVRAPSNPTPAEEFAAEDLRRHLLIMTGQPLADRHSALRGAIYLNNWSKAEAAGITSAKLKLSGDAFHLVTSGTDLHLLSANDRGIIYAAGEVLRRLGARWYTPAISHIPRLREAVLPALNETVRPAFEYRDMIAKDCAAPAFLARLRVNGHFSRIPDYMGGHMVYGMHVHTFYRLVPPHKYFAAHPEYFSLVNGKRVGSGAQLCLTNPAVCRIAVENILRAIKDNPSSKIFSVSQNDWNGACECPGCRKVVRAEGSEAGPVLRFANAVADAVGKKHPDILISTLAYTYTLDAPRKTKPRPNVRVRLCPIGCCSGHPFGTCGDEKSVRFVKAFSKWSALTRQMYIWHYSIDFSNYALPYPNFDELEGNLRYYLDNGVYGVFIQDMGEDGFGAESADLRGFLQAELLWNPRADVWPLVNEWVAAVHGSAAPAVMRYYRLFHDFVRRNRDIHPACYAKPDHPLYNRKLLARADAALAEGEKMASGFSRKRIGILRAGVRLPGLYSCGGTYSVKGSLFAGHSTPRDVRDINIIARRWKEYGITHPGEGLCLAEAVNQWRSRVAPHRLLRIRADGNDLRVAPTLGGRLLAWHAHGRQWLAMPDPHNQYQAYPFSGGYSEMAICGVYSFQGWRNSYRVESRSARSAGLACECEHWSCGCLKMSRVYALKNGALSINSRVENRGPTARDLRWDGSLQLALPGWTALDIPAASGSARLVPGSLEDGFAKARVMPVRRGGGTWRLELRGHRITSEFPDGIAEIIAGTNKAENILAVNIRSAAISLRPGESFETRQVVRIDRT